MWLVSSMVTSSRSPSSISVSKVFIVLAERVTSGGGRSAFLALFFFLRGLLSSPERRRFKTCFLRRCVWGYDLSSTCNAHKRLSILEDGVWQAILKGEVSLYH